MLSPDVRGQYLDAAVQVIESNETEVPFKVSAVKSIQQSVPCLALFTPTKGHCVDHSNAVLRRIFLMPNQPSSLA